MVLVFSAVLTVSEDFSHEYSTIDDNGRNICCLDFIVCDRSLLTSIRLLMFRSRRHRSFALVCCLFVCVLVLTLLTPWVSAKEKKTKPQEWQIRGIEAALEDSYPEVQKIALSKIAEYDLKDPKTSTQDLERATKKIASLLKDEKVKTDVRASAATSLGNLGPFAQPFVKDLMNVVSNQKVDVSIRREAVIALRVDSSVYRKNLYLAAAQTGTD